jgi:hypothetical protein
MPASDILASTGGLPPSAFQLLPHPEPYGSTVGLDHDTTDYQNDFSLFTFGSAEDGTFRNVQTYLHPTDSSDMASQGLFQNISTAIAAGESVLAIEPSSPCIGESKPTNQVGVSSKSGVFPAQKQAGKRRFRLPKQVTEVLDEQFHIEPYPDKSEISSIAKLAKMTAKQVKTWFSNKRSRAQFLREYPFKCETEQLLTLFFLAAHDFKEVDNTQDGTSSKLTRSSLDSLAAQIGPEEQNITLSNFLDSSQNLASYDSDIGDISTKAVSTDALTTALLDLSPSLQRMETQVILPEYPSSAALSRESSLILPKSTAHSVAGSKASSGKSGVSHMSGASSWSLSSRVSRRGRRKWIKDPSPYSKPPSATKPTQEPNAFELPEDSNITYCCAFCPKKFSARYTWNRHEESVHVQRKLWICRPEYLEGFLDSELCPYCTTGYPTRVHLDSHSHFSCSEQTEVNRKFFRKDNMAQHLRTVHDMEDKGLIGVLVTLSEVDSPPLDAESPVLDCKICGLHSQTWEQRVEHVANHFKAKARMKKESEKRRTSGLGIQL